MNDTTTALTPSLGANSNDDNGVVVNWHYSVAGTDSSDRTRTGVCSLSGRNIVGGSRARVGDKCKITAVGKATSYNNYTSVAVVTLTVGQGQWGRATWTTYLSTATPRFGTNPVPTITAPVITPTADSWAYTSLTTSICRPGNSDTLQILASGRCTLKAVPTRQNYATHSGVQVSFDIGKADNRGWTTGVSVYATTVTVGTPITPGNNLPHNGDGGLEYRVWSQSSINGGSASTHCTVRQSDGQVSGAPGSVGEVCHIQVRWKGNANYLASEWFRITRPAGISVQAGNIGGTWTGYSSSSLTWSESLTAPTLQTPTALRPSGAGTAYSSRTSSVCTVDSSTGALTIRSAGDCTIRLTISSMGYDSVTLDRTITISKATQASAALSSWSNPYGASPEATVGGTGESIVGAEPTGKGDVEYSVHSGDATKCSVDSGTGAVTALAAGGGSTCRIQANFAGNTNYQASSPVVIATITITKGTLSITAWGSYGAVRVGADTNPPDITYTTVPGITFSYSPGSNDFGCNIASDGVVRGAGQGTGNCRVRVTASATGYTSVPHDYPAISVALGSQSAPGAHTGGTPYGGATASLSVPNTKAIGSVTKPANPASNPPGGALEYFSSDESVCTVNATSGLVTAVDGGTCEIRARFGAAAGRYGQSSSILITTFTISEGTLSITNWGTYPAVNVGADTSAPTITRTNVPGLDFTYSRSAGSGCTVGSDGVVRGLTRGTGNCTVKVVASAAGYTDVPHTYSALSVGLGSQSAPGAHTGTPYGGTTVSLTVPATKAIGTVTKPANPATNPAGGALEYVSSDTDACTVHATSGLITSVGAGTCVITARYKAVTNKYAQSPASATITTVTVSSGGIAVTSWGSYAAVSVGTSADAPALTGLSPADAEKDYTSLTGTICTVNDDGRVTGVADGSCRIRLTLSKDGYVDTPHTYTFNVALGSWTSVAWSGYSGSATFRAAAPSLVAPTSIPTADSWTYTSSTASVCTVTGGALTIEGGGTCTVKAVPVKAGYAVHAGVTIRLTVARAVNPGSVSVVNVYGADVTVGSPRSPGNNLHSNGQGGLEFRVWDRSSTSVGAASTHCSVDTDGVLSGNPASVGSDCYVHARWKGNDDYEPSSWFRISRNGGIEVLAGAISLTWTGYSPSTVTWSESLTVPTLQAPTGTPSGAALAYSNRTASVCTANSGTGALTINSAGTCTIRLTVTATGYARKRQDRTVTINKASQSALTWSNPYGASPQVRIGDTIATTGTPPTAQGALQYRVESGDSSYCSVAADGVVTPKAAGVGQDCVIEARFRSTTNYAATSWGEIATIAILAAAPVESQQSVSAPVYTEGANLYVGSGNVVTIETAPAVTDSDTSDAITSGVTLTYSAVGKRGTTETANVCAIDSGSGQVTVGSAAADDDTCEVTVTSEVDGYADGTAMVTLTVEPAITFTAIKARIFDKAAYGCTTCHGASGSYGRFLESESAMNSRSNLLNSTNRLSSTLYTRTNNNTMPPAYHSGRQNLSAKDKEFVASYLRGGSWE